MDKRVDFLAHFHRAEFGGVSAARPAGDHDGDNQHADLAQHENSDQIDDIGLRAELAEMKDALLGDDCANQKSDQGHDRYRLPSDLVQVIDQRFQPERTRPSQDAETGRA